MQALRHPIGQGGRRGGRRVDENGQVHYSETIPPGYEGREYADPKYRTPEYRPPEYRIPEYANPEQRLELLESQIKLTEVYLGNLRKKLADQQGGAQVAGRANLEGHVRPIDQPRKIGVRHGNGPAIYMIRYVRPDLQKVVRPYACRSRD